MEQEHLFEVYKMSCAGCANTIQKLLQNTPGIQKAEVNFDAKELHVIYDDSLIGIADIAKRIQMVGYDINQNPKSN